jgi:hypothetical protein
MVVFIQILAFSIGLSIRIEFEVFVPLRTLV